MDKQPKTIATYPDHIKDLNSNVAKWVADQLISNPDGDWLDRVKEYISDAERLEADCAAAGDKPADSKPADAKPAPLFGQAGGFGAFPPMFSAAPSFGAPSSAPKRAADDDDDDVVDDTPTNEEAKAPSEVQVNCTDEEIVHEAKCKLRVSEKTDNGVEWRERGIGNLSARKSTTGGGSRLIFRREGVGVVVANAAIYAGIKPTLRGKSFTVMLFNAVQEEEEDGKPKGSGEPVPSQFLFTLKDMDGASAFVDAILKLAPSK